MALPDISFLMRNWSSARQEIISLRKRVFMDEQGLPLNFLRHRDDAERVHVLIYEHRSGQAIATGCIHRDGHIGRIAILEPWRTPMLGEALVAYLINVGRALSLDSVWLNAPTESLTWFQRRPFEAKGEEFSYCGQRLKPIRCPLAA